MQNYTYTQEQTYTYKYNQVLSNMCNLPYKSHKYENNGHFGRHQGLCNGSLDFCCGNFVIIAVTATTNATINIVVATATRSCRLEHSSQGHKWVIVCFETFLRQQKPKTDI